MTLKEINEKISESGLMQKHIAKQIGVRNDLFNRMLRGKIPMNEEVMMKLEMYLKR